MVHDMRPAPLAFVGLWIWLILAFVATLQPDFYVIWQAAGIILLSLTLYDLWQLHNETSIVIQRHVATSLALGVWSEVTLKVHNPNKTGQLIELFDDYPIHSELQGLPQRLRLATTVDSEMVYRICPQQRGMNRFNGVHLLIYSRYGLWKQSRYYPLKTQVKVYPNFAAVTKYALLATQDRLGQLGIRRLQRRGEGLEFHQLREYQSGDVLRQIDWNATSRLKKLISKEYQDERDQRVIFLIDCGRRMLAQDGVLSHFDHTLNAVLLLSYVALRQGDALGLMTFSGEPRWLPPRKGINTLNIVLDNLYDLQPTMQASDYLWAAHQFMVRHPRRALVIVISNLRDEESDELLPALQLLRRKHLVLLASLQERILNEVLAQPVDSFDAALRYTATHHYLNQRRQAHEIYKEHGIIYFDTEPEQLPIMMVNRYLEIKRAGKL